MTTENTTPPQNPAPQAAPRVRRQGPWLAVALVALALAGWQWFETRQKLNDLQQEVSRKLIEFDTGNKEERGVQKQTREQIEALQTADSRLARLDRPAYLPLRKAVAKDLERLNALPFVDMPGLSLRLEQLILSVDKLPLTAYGRPVEKAEVEK